MSLFDINILKNISFHNQFSCGDVTVFGFLIDYPSKITFDLYAYKGNLIQKPIERNVAFIYTEIRDNLIYIIDVQSQTENLGNGRKLFYNLLKSIILVNKVYPISKMYGFLSPYDYDHWNKLLHFYSNLNKYVSSQNDISVKLDFKLRNYTIQELVSSMNEHKNENIYFDIYITYL